MGVALAGPHLAIEFRTREVVMIQTDQIVNLREASQILAAHGVYALTLIFIFYQQWRAYQNLKTASAKDHKHFRKVHTSVVVATYTLAAISTVVWVYATFFYTSRVFIRGAVTGLTEQSVRPEKEEDPPKVMQSIIPDTVDVELYQSKRNKDDTAKDGRYDLAWVLVPQQSMRSLVFRFQHHYEVARRRDSASQPFATSPGSNEVTFESRTIPRRFQVDLKKLNFTPGDYIHLMYEGLENPREIGKVFVWHDGGKTEIPWEKDAAQSVSTPSRAWFSFTALAASSDNFAFKDDGTYDIQFGRTLRNRLGSLDLKTQLGARQLLVDAGKRSFRFMQDSLSDKKEDGFDRDLLVHNIGAALEQIESKGSRPDKELVVNLAMAFYETQDFDSCARFFKKAGNVLDKEDLYFYRAYAYERTRLYEEAIGEYHKYLDSKPTLYAQSVTYTNIAVIQEGLQQDADAIRNYEKAIRLNAKNPDPYNNLAYLYAERGMKLTEALSLVDRALGLDPQNANVKDTKGWALFKMGRRDAAIPFLKEAAAADPANKVLREHLAAAEKISVKK